MAWFDILGGVAGGLNQGLGQLQQAQQAKQVEARQQQLLKLQQAQDLRAQEAAARAEERARLQELMEMLGAEDPRNISGETMAVAQQKYADLLPGRVRKNVETGTYEVPLPPEKMRALVQQDQREQLTKLVEDVAPGQLTETNAMMALTRGGVNPSLILSKLAPSARNNFLRQAYPEVLFRAELDKEQLNLRERAATGRTAMEVNARLAAAGAPDPITNNMLYSAANTESGWTDAQKDLQKAQEQLTKVQNLPSTSRFRREAEERVALAQQQVQAADQERRRILSGPPPRTLQELLERAQAVPSAPSAGAAAPAGTNPFRR